MYKTKLSNQTYSIIKNQDILDMSIDRTSTHTIIIPHVCNNINAFGGGFAGYLSNRVPHIKDNFHLLGNQAKLGYVQFIDAFINKNSNNNIVIANMIAQNGLINKNNSRPLNYYALATCMNAVKRHIIDLKNKDIATNVEIHCPKFGSGLAGGNWQFITNLIEDIWNTIPVLVYIK